MKSNPKHAPKLTSKNPAIKPRSNALNEIIFILLLALALVYLAALVSYSPDESPWSGDVDLSAPVVNQAGVIGAYLSDISLSILGYSAYIMPILLLWLGYSLHQKNTQNTQNIGWLAAGVRLLAFMVFVFFSSALAQYIPEPSGGWIGLMMAGYFAPLFGAVAPIIYVSIMMVSFSVLSDTSWAGMFVKLGDWVQMLATKLLGSPENRQLKREARRAQRATKQAEKLAKQAEQESTTILMAPKMKVAKIQETPVKIPQNPIIKTSAKMPIEVAEVAEAVVQPSTQPPIQPPETVQKSNVQSNAQSNTQSSVQIKSSAKVSTNLFQTPSESGLPDLALLDEMSNQTTGYSAQKLAEISEQVELKLKDFGFDVKVTTVTPGPVVTQFELSLAPGVKVSKIVNLNKDLARALLVESVRIVDVIPGKPVIGLEIPNAQREMISLKEIFASDVFIQAKSPLTMGLGKDINGLPVITNLAKMPHLLVAGATGMGKSVGLNAMILSVLYKSRPDQVRIIMIDPKIVELACYADIPHLLTPVVTDMNQAANALWWCVNEMERRYLLLAKFGVRNIDGFNDKLAKFKEKGEPLLDPAFNADAVQAGEVAPELAPLPLIMLVIDEYADMLGALAQEDRTKAKRVESLIVRLAQKARAAGIHLIIATQRPSVDVITGLIKSNVPTRIAFKVSSKVDSRTILDQGGADQLLGMGDMLYMTPGMAHIMRVHGAFVDDDEIARVVGFLKDQSPPNYLPGVLNPQADAEAGEKSNKNKSGESDALYDEAVKIVTSTRKASISSLQRRLRIGYNRAARIIEDMEESGVVSAMNSAGNRQVLAPVPVGDA